MNKFTPFFCISFLCISSLLYAQNTHSVQKGDTLYSIGRKYGVTVAELCAENGITDASVLKAGQVLKIPETKKTTGGATAAVAATPAASEKAPEKSAPTAKTESYTVVKGDTLYSIARRMGITVDVLKMLNQMSGNDTIKVGQILSVPQKNDAPAAKTAAVSAPAQPLVDPRVYDNSKKAAAGLMWPVQALDIVYTKGKVSGVQLSAQQNARVSSVSKGTVIFSGVYRGFGQVIFIQAKEYTYVYSGLGSISVKQGDTVAYRDIIGTVGRDGLTEKSNILFMAFKNNIPVDPAKVPRG